MSIKGRVLVMAAALLLVIVSLGVARLLLPRGGGQRVTPPAGDDPRTAGLYPVWTTYDLPAPPQAGEAWPPPSMSGVYAAPGYLLVPTAGMGKIAESYGNDPTVHVLDGDRWREGRFTDHDAQLEVALIRVDLPDTRPAEVALGDRPVGTIATLAMLSTGELRLLRTHPKMCGDNVRGVDTAEVLNGTVHCYVEEVSGVPGAALLDERGRLVGIQVKEDGSRLSGGPGLSILRGYIDTYNLSWGRYVEPKMKL